MPSDPQNEQDHPNRVPLEEYEQSNGKPAFVLSMTEVKLLGIAGVGFFLDGEPHNRLSIPQS